MNALVPVAELKQIASALSYNKMFGKTADELLPLLLIAQAEGKHPAIAAQEYDIIQGRPAINSKSALSRFQAAGGCIQWVRRSDDKASATFTHPQGGELTVTWSMDRAKQAGLTGKENWKKYPAQMLSARVVAEGVRAVFPACLSGMYTTEEVQDFDPPKETAAAVKAPAAEAIDAEIIDPPKTISRAQAGEIVNTLKAVGIPAEALLAQFGIGRFGEITIDQLPAINQWIDIMDNATEAAELPL